MGNHRAENTSNVATNKGDLLNVSPGTGGEGRGGDLSLDEFSVFMFRFGEGGVNVLDNSLKRREFHHGVRDLSSPERLQALVQSSHSLGRSDLVPTLEGSAGEGGDGSLHADFDGFPWTKEDVGEEFGGCRGGEIECCTVFMGGFFAYDVGVLFLEDFVETVLSSTYNPTS